MPELSLDMTPIHRAVGRKGFLADWKYAKDLFGELVQDHWGKIFHLSPGGDRVAIRNMLQVISSQHLGQNRPDRNDRILDFSHPAV